ncbi:MAG: exported protein of unknown function [Phycisphaerales bacterium]|nr:exported protein of unknown function [Phycisphaerales bacterium]
MKAVKKVSQFQPLETLEDRRLMSTTPWGAWPILLGQDKLVAAYPWLTGDKFNVAVIDKGIDYWHYLLGGDRATGTKSPKIVNVYDYRDNDTDPFPSESDAQNVDPSSPHATGVAGILVANPYTAPATGSHPAQRYQGIIQDSLLYNIRTNRLDSQNTIKLALQWVLDNHVKYHITAINLTDFVGTGASTPVYDAQVKALYNAGVFIITPVANEWLNATAPKAAIGNPAKSPYIFGSGGSLLNDTIRPETQRGAGLDILSQSLKVTLPYYQVDANKDVLVEDAGTGNSWGAPTVLGTAVLIQQIDPTITPAEIMKILQDSGHPIVDPDGTGTYARLDMYAAIQLAYQRRDDGFDQVKGGNEDMVHAGLINLDGQNKGSISGLKLLMHDHDYYTFNVDAPADFNISIGYTGPSAFPTGELLDADGNLVGTIGQDGITAKRLPAGQYFVHLFNADAALDGSYSVNINQPAVVGGGGGSNGPHGQNGTFNDIAYDKNNNLDMVWYDSANGVLKYAQRDSAKVWGTTQIIDNGVQVGNFASMTLDSQGRPGVAYYDANQADLKYAHFNGSSWDVQTVESTKTTGYYPSLKYDNSDNPVIAYYYKTSGDLKLATGSSSGWSFTTVDSKGDVGRYPSLGLNPATGRWGIAYESTSAGAFRYAAQTKSGWNVTTVDVNGAGGGFISLAFDQNSNPAFSYYDAQNSDLRFARFTGTKWSTTTVASKRSQGLYTNLFFDAGNGGNPVIYYFNKTNNTLMDARSDGSTWTYEVLATGGGRHNQVALNSDDFETFTWYDDATGDLKVADL